MKKKISTFSIGYFLTILIIFIIPILIMYPNVIKTIENEYKQIDHLNNLKNNEKSLYSSSDINFLKEQVNIRNYVICYYVSSLCFVLLLMGFLSIKIGGRMKIIGKGILIGVFVGGAGILSIFLFNSSYFIL